MKTQSFDLLLPVPLNAAVNLQDWLCIYKQTSNNKFTAQHYEYLNVK